MSVYVDALFAFVVVLHLLGLVVSFLLYRELVGVRFEARAREAESLERERKRESALARLLGPVVRPAARPVRGFLGHVPAPPASPTSEPVEGPGDASDGAVEVEAVVIYRRYARTEEAERVVREIAG